MINVIVRYYEEGICVLENLNNSLVEVSMVRREGEVCAWGNPGFGPQKYEGQRGFVRGTFGRGRGAVRGRGGQIRGGRSVAGSDLVSMSCCSFLCHVYGQTDR